MIYSQNKKLCIKEKNVAALNSLVVENKNTQLHTIVPEYVPHIAHYQKTIANSISCQGIGVHSADSVSITLHPAVSGSGITFIRTDLDDAEVKANWKTVVDTKFCTTIGNELGVTVSTVEHLLAALAARGIDNVRVEINGPELPIMDGSAQPFVELIDKAGVKEQKMPRKAIRVLKPITVKEGDREVSLSPASDYIIDVAFDFGGRTVLSTQHRTFRPLEDDFAEDISMARTFGLLEDAEKLWSMGLSKGASLENTLVYDKEEVVNEEGARFDDECARHKILDVLGDLHLAGGLILGKFRGHRPGHGLHHKLLLALFADPSAYVIEVL